MNIRQIQKRREHIFFNRLTPKERIEFAVELSELVYEIKNAVKKEYERRANKGCRTTKRGKRP